MRTAKIRTVIFGQSICPRLGLETGQSICPRLGLDCRLFKSGVVRSRVIWSGMLVPDSDWTARAEPNRMDREFGREAIARFSRQDDNGHEVG